MCAPERCSRKMNAAELPERTVLLLRSPRLSSFSLRALQGVTGGERLIVCKLAFFFLVPAFREFSINQPRGGCHANGSPLFKVFSMLSVLVSFPAFFSVALRHESALQMAPARASERKEKTSCSLF